MPDVTTTLAERCKIKKALNARLKADGYWPQYNALRAHLKSSGVEEGLAWRAAAYPFPPKDSSVAEVVADPKYSEIAANWVNGKYTMPDTLCDSRVTESATGTDSGPPDPNSWKADWEKLAAEVGDRSASELEETRWVVANYLINAKRIQRENVPSAAALSILMWVQMSPANFGDFLRTNHSKLLPDKKSLEREGGFVDDGRSLELLEDFERGLDAEGRTKLREKYLSLDAAKRTTFKRIVENLQEENLTEADFFGAKLFLEFESCSFPVSELCELLPQWDREQPAEAAATAGATSTA
jgi:hypothetical protein